MIKTCKPDWIISDLVAMCPKAPVTMLMRSLMRAVRDFSTTCMYQEWIDIPVQSGVQYYPFERYLPEGYTVQYVTSVMYNNCCIPCLDDDCKSQCQSGYRLDDLRQISLYGYCPSDDDPECPDVLRVQVVLRPNNDACEIPCDMLEQFEEELTSGALSYLMAMKGHSWADGSQADFYRNEFRGGIASAKCLIDKKFNPTDDRIPGEKLI